MRIEKQVCTREQGERLQTLGINQNVSLFNHVTIAEDPNFERCSEEILYCNEGFNCMVKTDCSAFSCAELGKMMGSDAETKDDRFGGFLAYQNKTGTAYSWVMQDKMQHIIIFNTEAEARAAMIIHLIENNIVSVEEINKRLIA